MSRVFARGYASSSRSPSSSRYLARQRKDPFAAGGGGGRGKGKEQQQGEPFVSRAAHKLLQLDARDGFLTRNPSRTARPGGLVVVDLGAAPGGWTQVALSALASSASVSGKAGLGGHVFSLDVLDLDARVLAQSSQGEETALTFLKGNFNDVSVRSELGEAIGAWRGHDGHGDAATEGGTNVDVVLSDMMANTTGSALRDAVLSLDLVQSALNFACAHLVAGRAGFFVAKYFESSDANEFRREELQPRFEAVASRKVAASRSESREMYWVCRGYKGNQLSA
ncbi:ribosomal RNA methyltransferase [Acaromyces ingoldii]|uniref:rRNA methyltransferase 2, mitochondrial n=1 Tax=Acaromyces ingoldii TaxID=215250 RepID=A0A316YVG1_9BASI|nr:ribosomal RNA methyltransferase [Acaromyces ingoldii]PWN93102.1 ribosomal RNA methyltransferase [Acaromyces ingoldii]